MAYTDYGIRLTQMIYAFHMPVFVFLSGYFTSLKPDFKKHLHWVLASLAIFVLAQWAQCLYDIALPFFAPHGVVKIPWRKLFLYMPGFSLWYLLSLIYWRIGTWIFHNRISDKVLLGLSFLAAITSGLFPASNHLSFQRTFVFLPFFVLGYLFKKHQLDLRMQKIPLWMCYAILPIIGLSTRWLPIFAPSFRYTNLPHDLIIRAIQTILALILSFGLIRVFCSWPIEKLSRWGKHTLWIYIGHAIPILFQNLVVAKFKIPINIASAVVVSIGYVVCFTLAAEIYYRNFQSKKEIEHP